MARTTFSGPVASDNGFIGNITGTTAKLTVTTTGALGSAATAGAGAMRIVSDNGVGNNEYCLVISTGSAWVTATGAALS